MASLSESSRSRQRFVAATLDLCGGLSITLIHPAHFACCRILTCCPKIGQTDFALDVAVRALEFYTNIFEIPYALDKLDLVAIPDFSAGGKGLLSLFSSYFVDCVPISFTNCTVLPRCRQCDSLSPPPVLIPAPLN